MGSLGYVWLVLVLRISGKRTLAQLNAFDFIVTVALGSTLATLATVALSNSVVWTEGALALALLAALQFIAAWLSVRVRWMRAVITSEPTVLLRNGHLVARALKQERVCEQSLRAAVRGAGVGGLELVAAVVLETNGTLSVIRTSALGSGSAVHDVDHGARPAELETFQS